MGWETGIFNTVARKSLIRDISAKTWSDEE